MNKIYTRHECQLCRKEIRFTFETEMWYCDCVSVATTKTFDKNLFAEYEPNYIPRHWVEMDIVSIVKRVISRLKGN